MIATAVAWRTAVALGNDLDARPFCVDKLLKLGAKSSIEIDGSTTIVVDEAGMLSTRQAHHVLRLAERRGAKVVFAGDTRQQQPVEAGPGLRLIRDAVGSVRVDRIRRQKPDLEDILVHVHGETPSAARFRGGLMGEEERIRIFADYGAIADKPAFAPWQVDVSEALRDGDAAQAIEAWHERGCFHLGYNGERTLTALVDEWDRYTRQRPENSVVVLARTRAEVRVLSHLMREKRFARHREVDSRHDEIRDWYGNIRLDHGYALTIAATQGLTVDKTFLLADDRPARETIYPAATRHREEIDVYVNCAPLALDVADRRADGDRDAPVLDSEIRTYLAERWSRSKPKEAALDYMADGAWEERGVREHRDGAFRDGDLAAVHTVESRPASNDNALVRIAREVQCTSFAWRHGAAVDAFAAGREEVLDSWDELRERTRADGDAVALSDTYRETLDRHDTLLKQAERSGILRNDLDAFEQLHDRARRHRQAATMRQVHRVRRDEQLRETRPEEGRVVQSRGARAVDSSSPAPEVHQGEMAPDGGRGEAPAKPRKGAPDTATAPPLDHGETRAEDAVTPLPPKPPKPERRPAPVQRSPK